MLTGLHAYLFTCLLLYLLTSCSLLAYLLTCYLVACTLRSIYYFSCAWVGGWVWKAKLMLSQPNLAEVGVWAELVNSFLRQIADYFLPRFNTLVCVVWWRYQRLSVDYRISDKHYNQEIGNFPTLFELNIYFWAIFENKTICKIIQNTYQAIKIYPLSAMLSKPAARWFYKSRPAHNIQALYHYISLELLPL